VTLLDATATLIDCAKTYADHDKSVMRAVARMEKRLRLLQLRAARARRSRRRSAWRALQFFAPVCRCSHRFTFGQFVRSAEIDGRGWIQRFVCPACRGFVIKYDKPGNRYLVDCLSARSGKGVPK
jgi:hypothetical protein